MNYTFTCTRPGRAGHSIIRLTQEFAVVTAFVLPIGCSPSDEADGSVIVRDSAGVTIVRNVKGPKDTLVIVAEPIVSIGVVDGPTEYTFGDIADVRMVSDRSLVVADKRGRVALFDSRGRWTRDIGRRGSGPGEYRAPASLEVVGDTIVVWDNGLGRILRYLPDGTALSTVSLRYKAALGRPVAVYGAGFVDEAETGQLQDRSPAEGMLVHLSGEGAVVDTIVGPYSVPEYGWEIVDDQGRRGQMVMPPALSVYPAWTVDADMILLTETVEPAVEYYGGEGRRFREIWLDRRAAPPTMKQREDYFKLVSLTFNFDDDAMARVREETEFVRIASTISDIFVDDRKNLWVGTLGGYRWDGVGRSWDIVASSGRQTGHVIFPDRFRLTDVVAGSACGIVVTDMGVQSVRVYDLSGRLSS